MSIGKRKHRRARIATSLWRGEVGNNLCIPQIDTDHPMSPLARSSSAAARAIPDAAPVTA